MLILGRKNAILLFSSYIQSHIFCFSLLKASYPVSYTQYSALKIKALGLAL